ncbi:DUF4192 domain-containing protein [Streptomyces sp. A012304]|uniref:DUF4192 domain-containing protein n=1 Tax=Streptomyces sp. A012304 TaxID=375446 RepID=UPI0022308458|nr:DUF4192 domain-containing protein [Streptomyces sp. A012304]GKQ35577.1 hypothetical protein ALMP_21200 [Streptomyces sp. A012304]
MTNHSETTGSFENFEKGDISRRDEDTGLGQRPPCDAQAEPAGDDAYDSRPSYEGHTPYDGPSPYEGSGGAHQVTLRTPAELADALPYLLGYRPEDSIVLVALHDRGGRGRFGGRARIGIPADPDDWDAVARQLARGLVTGSTRRGARPEQMVAYLCQEPAKGETGRQVMERLEPLAQLLRVACGRLDVPVIEALCISGGRFWSYCCSGQGCCPVEGAPMGLPGTSVVAAAATYAGIQVRGTLRELRARLLPLETGAASEQEAALDTASMALVPRIVDAASRAAVAEETVELAGRIMRRFAEAPPMTGALPADHRDDELLGPDEAAALILGLQDRVTRDRAAEWMEGDEAAPALRLWRALARRCVGPYAEHAAAPLTLAGWVAWSSGDELEAREALAMALGADPDYLFARLLHQACNEGLDPETVRRCLRGEREGRDRRSRRASLVDDVGAGERQGVPAAAAGTESGNGAAPEADPAPATPVGRRRRRTRSAETARRTPQAAVAREHAPQANPVRPRPPMKGATRPVAPGKGEPRPRTRGSARSSARRRDTCSEATRSEGHENTGEG